MANGPRRATVIPEGGGATMHRPRERTTVVARDVEYPGTITVNAGEVSFFVQNKDRFRHTFVIEGQDVKTELPGSTARRVTATLAPGTYTFKCDVPGHETMKGTLIAR